MKLIKDEDGVYRRRALSPSTSVRTSIWISIFSVLTAGLLSLHLNTRLIEDSSSPQLELTRKHSYRLAVVGDIACQPSDPNYNEGNGIVNACQHKKVAESIARDRVDAVVLLGDIQYYYGRFEDFESSFVPPWRAVTRPLYIVPGNHDYGDGSLAGYTKTWQQFFPSATYQAEGRPYYTAQFGDWRAYALDSNCEFVGGCDTNSEQYKYLTRQVSSTMSTCSLAMWHHPTLTSGVHQEPDSLARAANFSQLLDQHGVDIVLNGHDHDYERLTPPGAGYRQFVVGTGGMNLRPAPGTLVDGSELFDAEHFGYLYLELFPGRYEWQFKNTEGMVLDSGQSSCR